MNRILLAEAVGYTASGVLFRDLITASGKFGLTKGSYAAEVIELTPLGLKIVRPASDAERLEAVRQAVQNIPLFAQVVDHYKNNKLPAPEFLRNILEREPFSVDPAWSEEAVKVFIDTGRYVGIIRETKGGPYLLPDAGPQVSDEPEADDAASDDVNKEPDAVPVTLPTATAPGNGSTTSSPIAPSSVADTSAPVPTQFFVAHGTDDKSLSQLKDMLTKLTIPFVVAKDEPHGGRPISQKVADLMRSCSGGIFIFSGDDEYVAPDDEKVLLPRLNVVFELGAASLLYGQRVVIFKQEGIELPSDFRDLGYIEFKKGELSAKTMELMMELIKLQALRLVPATG